MQSPSPLNIQGLNTYLPTPQPVLPGHALLHPPTPHLVYSQAQPLPNSRVLPAQGIPITQSMAPLPPHAYPIQTLPFSPQPYSIPPPYQVAPVTYVQPPPRAPLNFDYTEAELLCDAKIIENTVHCVICNEDYKSSEKATHILKHRRNNNRPFSNKSTLQRVSQYKLQQNAFKKHMVRPVVPPETHVVDFKPNSYELIQEIIYDDQDRNEKVERAIGPQGDGQLKPVDFRYQQSNMSNNSMNQPVNWYNSGQSNQIQSPKNYDRGQWANSQFGTGVNYAPRAEHLSDGDNVDSQDTLYPRGSSIRPNSYAQPNNPMIDSMNEPVNWYNPSQEPYPGANSGNSGNIGGHQSYGKSQETNYPQNSVRDSNYNNNRNSHLQPDRPIIYEENASNSQLDSSVDKATPRGQPYHPDESVRQSQPYKNQANSSHPQSNNSYQSNDPYSPGIRQSNDPRYSNDPRSSSNPGQHGNDPRSSNDPRYSNDPHSSSGPNRLSNSNDPYNQRQSSYNQPSNSRGPKDPYDPNVGQSSDPNRPSQAGPSDHYQPTSNNRNSNDPYDSSVRQPNNPDPYESPLKPNNSNQPYQSDPARHTDRNPPSQFSEPMSIKDSSGQSEIRTSNILQDLGLGGNRASTGRRRIASQAEW